MLPSSIFATLNVAPGKYLSLYASYLRILIDGFSVFVNTNVAYSLPSTFTTRSASSIRYPSGAFTSVTVYEPVSRLSSLISPFSSVVYSFSNVPPTFLNLNTAFGRGSIVSESSFTSRIYGFWSFKKTSSALSPMSFVISIDCGVEFTIWSSSVATSLTVYVPVFKS